MIWLMKDPTYGLTKIHLITLPRLLLNTSLFYDP